MRCISAYSNTAVSSLLIEQPARDAPVYPTNEIAAQSASVDLLSTPLDQNEEHNHECSARDCTNQSNVVHIGSFRWECRATPASRTTLNREPPSKKSCQSSRSLGPTLVSMT